MLFYVNGSKERNGIVPIMGRVTINGTVAQFSCKQTIPKTLWDVKGDRAKGKSAEARDINLALDNIKAQTIKHYQHISDREAYVTTEMVRNAYQGIGSEYETLIKAFDKNCANFLKRVGKDRSIGTYKVMVRARNYVAAFIKSFYKRTDMSMPELTPDFIREFAAYLTAAEKGNGECGIEKRISYHDFGHSLANGKSRTGVNHQPLFHKLKRKDYTWAMQYYIWRRQAERIPPCQRT